MALTPGTRLGPYEIQTPLGAGGMGEVYKAKDSRLDRTVAIKVLPEHVASDPTLKQRFEREAKTLSSLNHPHICTIHDVGSQDGIDFLVMEHLEGETLAQRLSKGALALDQAFQVAIQIADALDKAHRRGIVHRDLKPGNIMLTKTGAKLLDFGLAKLRPADVACGVALSEAPTISSPLTGAGSIFGTFQYMAPEQLEGREADARTDIFAFGAVAYEMVTGKKAFEGKNQASLTSAIMSSDPPPISAIGQVVSSSLDRVMRTCLAKDPDERFQSAYDLKRAIEWSVAGPEAALVPTSSTLSQRWVAWAAAAVFAVLAVAGWLRSPSENTVARDLVLEIAPREASGIASIASLNATPVISPDGSTVIYRNQSGGYQVRRLDSRASETLRIPDTRGSLSLFWAPDSRSVFFHGAGALWRLRLPGGAPERIATVQGPVSGGTQSDSGVLLFVALKIKRDLFIALAGGAEAQQVVLPGLPEGSYFLPEFLPGVDDFLVTFEPPGADEAETYLATLRDGLPADPVLLMRNRTAPRYTPAGGGQLLFVRDDVLYAQALNASARRLEGDPEVVERNVASTRLHRRGHFSVSNAGVLAWRPGGEGLAQLTTFDRAGREIGTSGPPSAIISVKLAPDERRLLLAARSEQWLSEPDQPGRLVVSRTRGVSTTLTTLWSPDSTRLLVPEAGRVLERPVSGGVEREIANVQGLVRLEDVSPDGNVVLFTGGPLATGVFAARLDGGGDPWPVLQTGERVWSTRFAPGGRWIVFEAYPDNVATGGGIYVQPFPGPGLRRQISPSGRFPVWRKDGAEIVFLDQDQVWSIRVEAAGADLRFSKPQPLFPVRDPGGVDDVTLLAITRDGSRIYLPQPIEQVDSDVIHIRTGWATQ